MARLQSKIIMVGAAILVPLLGILTFATTLFAQELYWAKSPGNGQGFAIAVDASRNSYVTGVIADSNNGNDVFLAKFDSNGTPVWPTPTTAGGGRQ